MVVRFHIVSPAAKQRTFTVRLPIMLGRGEEAKFRIQHDLISRKHCEFFERQGRVYVRDLGSTNGTFLNDEQVPASTRTAVAPGAVVRVGGLSFSVEYEPPAAGDSTATVEGQVRPETTAAGESRVATGAGRQPDADELPDFKIEHAEQMDEAAAGSAVATGVVTLPVEAVPAGPLPPFPKPEEDQPPAVAEESQGFAFLADADPASPPEKVPEWPTVDTAAEAPDDDQLNSFFKGLK